MQLTISLAQMEVILGQPEANFAKARELAAEAKRRGSDVLVLPELWATGYDLKNAAKHASGTDEGLFARVADLARERGIYIVGSLLEARGGRCYNTAHVFSPSGELMGLYRKIHLFAPMGEDRYLAAGGDTPLFDLPWGRAALAICYDLRFPELFRKYVLAGGRIIFVPAEWPHLRLAHWRTLLAARAIENQVFVAACNRVGGEFCGHSAIYDPWGEAVVEAGEGEVLLTAGVDLSLVNELRRRFPVLADRRPELYL